MAAAKKKLVGKRRAKRGGFEERVHPLDTEGETFFVDARQRETGEATVPAPDKEFNQANQRSTRGRECFKCGHRKSARSFQQLARAPVEYDTVCKACRAKEDAEELAAQRLDRKAQKESLKDERRRVQRIARKRAARTRANIETEARARRTRNVKKTEKLKKEDQEVLRELTLREWCRRKLLAFTMRFEGYQLDPRGDGKGQLVQAKHRGGYQAGWVHKDICRRLERFYEDVKAGRQPRLMLFMPPRLGKSTLASRMFPSWVFGQDPTMEIIAASYGATLPNEFSRFVRGMLRDPEYQAVFPQRVVDGGTVEAARHGFDMLPEQAALIPAATLDLENTNLEGWGTSSGGRYLPAGVGSGISGRGADIFIVDDPVKDQEDADSPAIREKVLDWYKAVANTRLSPRSGVLLIMTRWNDDDLAGALLAEQAEFEKEFEELYTIEAASLGVLEAEQLYEQRLDEIDRWEVVSYPAIAKSDEYQLEDGTIVDHEVPGAILLRKAGEALHPARFPETRLQRIRNGYVKRGRMRMWHALYQQEPVPEEGLHFKKERFVYEMPHAPSVIHEWKGLQAWDLALGEKKQNSWTVGVHGELDFDGKLHIIDMERMKKDDPTSIAEAILHFYARHRPSEIGIERTHMEMMMRSELERAKVRLNKSTYTGQRAKLTPYFLEGKDALVPIHDKLQRAGVLKGMHQGGTIIFPTLAAAPWMEQAQREMLRFPAGTFADVVDALSWLCIMASRTAMPKKPRGRSRKGPETWRERVNKMARQQRRSPMAA